MRCAPNYNGNTNPANIEPATDERIAYLADRASGKYCPVEFSEEDILALIARIHAERNSALRRLKPFATMANAYDDTMAQDGDPALVAYENINKRVTAARVITVGDFRRARHHIRPHGAV